MLIWMNKCFYLMLSSLWKRNMYLEEFLKQQLRESIKVKTPPQFSMILVSTLGQKHIELNRWLTPNKNIHIFILSHSYWHLHVFIATAWNISIPSTCTHQPIRVSPVQTKLLHYKYSDRYLYSLILQLNTLTGCSPSKRLTLYGLLEYMHCLEIGNQDCT